MDKIYVGFLLRRPAYQGPPRTSEEESVVQAHIKFVLDMQQHGSAIAAGPVLPGGEPGDLAGMSILRAASEEAAVTLLSADPGVRAGRFRVVIRQWLVPPGDSYPQEMRQVQANWAPHRHA